MCGIVGYIGKRECLPIIIEGLKKLEYRGYDSAGIAIIHESNICIRRSKGKIKNLESLISDKKIDGCVGIGHTRWATHGKPSDENAHPHRAGDITVVHNGIIENYQGLKGLLEGAAVAERNNNGPGGYLKALDILRGETAAQV